MGTGRLMRGKGPAGPTAGDAGPGAPAPRAQAAAGRSLLDDDLMMAVGIEPARH